jgi:hypothetical protein
VINIRRLAALDIAIVGPRHAPRPRGAGSWLTLSLQDKIDDVP